MMAVPVSGIWVRKTGRRVEVLAEVDGEWRRVFCEPISGFTDGEVSHIVEAAGIMAWPPAGEEIVDPAGESLGERYS